MREGRIVSMLEGGYDLEALRECSVAHVERAALSRPGRRRPRGVMHEPRPAMRCRCAFIARMHGDTAS